jgi:hypothetical protein
MDSSGRSDRIDCLERRVAELEARMRAPQTVRGWLRSLLRWLAVTPPLLILLLVGLDQLSTAASLSLGVVTFLVWASAVVVWAVVEVLAGGDLRFRLTRLIVIVAMLAAILGYWQVTVRQPLLTEQRCLAELKGLKGNAHRKIIGPGWIIALVGNSHFHRVVQLELAGPEADERQISRLRELRHLSLLFLSGPNFDDAMIDDLATLPDLREVFLTNSRVTKSGVERLRNARPYLEINRQGTIVDQPADQVNWDPQIGGRY